MTLSCQKNTKGALDAFFSPRSVAVIGASPGKSSYPNLVLRNLKAHRFSGDITVINPKYAEVDGVESLPSLAAMRDRPDLCVVGIRADLAVETIRQCVKCSVPAATIIARLCGARIRAGVRLAARALYHRRW
jgi:acyl-CoA synthetase (NDP forming)